MKEVVNKSIKKITFKLKILKIIFLIKLYCF